jgi:hypothetical protein
LIRRWLRGLIREELEEMREKLAVYLADLIAQNNEKIEDNLIEMGLLERDNDGELHVNARRL